MSGSFPRLGRLAEGPGGHAHTHAHEKNSTRRFSPMLLLASCSSCRACGHRLCAPLVPGSTAGPVHTDTGSVSRQCPAPPRPSLRLQVAQPRATHPAPPFLAPSSPRGVAGAADDLHGCAFTLFTLFTWGWSAMSLETSQRTLHLLHPVHLDLPGEQREEGEGFVGKSPATPRPSPR
jgi:hypothetical protein